MLPVVAGYLHLDLDVLRGLAPDETFPLELLPTPDQVDNSVATFSSLRSVMERTHPTTRQVVVKASGGNRHRELVGTPDDFADDVEEWLDAGVADGFTLLLPVTGRDLTYFADSVTPVLRARGLLRATPATGPLRARLT